MTELTGVRRMEAERMLANDGVTGEWSIREAPGGGFTARLKVRRGSLSISYDGDGTWRSTAFVEDDTFSYDARHQEAWTYGPVG